MAPLWITLPADLVEKAYWQIALTDSDEKFERALGRLLAPVLLKASSADSAVRDKVLCVWSGRIALNIRLCLPQQPHSFRASHCQILPVHSVPLMYVYHYFTSS